MRRIDTGSLTLGLLGLVVAGGIAAQQMGYIPKTSSLLVAGTDASNNVRLVPTEDPTMSGFVAQAQASLPAFLAAAEGSPGNWSNMSIKVALPGESLVENIWISDFKRSADGGYAGVIGNEPVDLVGVKLGDEVTFAYEQIVDWAFVENRKGYGFFTVRAMLDAMPEEQRAGMVAFLSRNPVPDQWPSAMAQGGAPASAGAGGSSATISKGFEMLRFGLGMGPRAAS